jgi:hypothetical protein
MTSLYPRNFSLHSEHLIPGAEGAASRHERTGWIKAGTGNYGISCQKRKEASKYALIGQTEALDPTEHLKED